MKTWHRFTIAAVTCAAGLTLACSGKTDGAGGGDGGGSSGGSSGGGSSACDDYFEAAFSGSCPGTLLPPPSEVTRIQGRFDTLCHDALALPGIGLTAASLELCVSAIKSDGCTALTESNGPCSVYMGTLGVGSSCVTNAQCLTGACSAGTELPDGGTTAACGTCTAAVPLGQSCANGQSCGPGATCSFGGTTAEICTTITYVGAGAACNSNTTQCSLGLECNPSGQCAAPGGAGATCEEDFDCVAPLVCPSVSGTSTCQPPGALGAPCVSAAECTLGLGCDFVTHECATVTFADAGQPCNETTQCLVGSCPTTGNATSGTCPTVIPDGQPCSESDTTSTCDTFANCTGGTCLLGYATCP